ncbi:MAG TPA: hypothetical protein PLK69_08695 [Tetrasphaera sp.]|nr:hypothetical protein [Tetrasphaera sp.]
MPAPAGERRARALTATALVLLVGVGLAGESAAVPPLGPRGWAPGALAWTLSPAVVTGVLVAAYGLGAAGVWLGVRAQRAWPRWAVALLGLGALLTMPFGSADHTNYAAYGRIALLGGDPYIESPVAWAGGTDPVTSGVQPPWQETPSIYGPLATLLQLGAAWVGGDNLRQVVWVWQVLVVAAWLMTRWLLRRLFPDAHGRIDALWTMNPILVGTAVLGAHVDTMATAFMVAALVLARRRGTRWALATGVICALAAMVKVTAGVALLAIALGWLLEAHRAGSRPRSVLARVGILVLGALLVALPLQLWAGGSAYAQLGRSRRSISLATPWRQVYEWFGGHLPDATWRSLVFALAAATCLLLAALGWRVLRDRVPDLGAPLVLALSLSMAYAVGAPYVLPWYDQLVWALLPGVALAAGGLLTRVWLVRGLILALAYVPGRVVGLTPGVESLTLLFRREIAPIAALLVWGALVLLARRATNGDLPSHDQLR